MKRIVDEAKRAHHSPEIIRVELKEYLQYFVLDFLYNSELKDLIFYGGSCLRILYELPRMSEDLDFEAEKGKIDFHALSKGLEKHFSSDLLMKKIKITPNRDKNIIRILLIFPIARELSLSVHKDETIKIKVEIRLVSTEYMKSVKWIFTPLSKYGKAFVVKHYDISTLMATKLMAILERPEKGFHKGHPDEGIGFKGRDFYDLLWYMDKGVLPNENMLRANGITKTIGEIFDGISIQISKMDTTGIQKDIENLFVNPEYIKNWIISFRSIFSRLREKRYRMKKDLKLNEFFIIKDFDTKRVTCRFEFFSPARELVDFFFSISFDLIRYKKMEGFVSTKISKIDEEKVVFWKPEVISEDRGQFLAYAAIFLKKIRNYLQRHGGVYFEEWRSRYIRLPGNNENAAEEYIISNGKELESDSLQLEELAQ